MQDIKVWKGFSGKGEHTLLGSFRTKHRISVCFRLFSPGLYESDLADCGVGMRQQRHCNSIDSCAPSLIRTSAPRQLLAAVW